MLRIGSTHCHKTSSSRRGFTLIELLVVIAIIALLIGILLPSLGSARLSAQSIIVASNARSVLQADILYTGSNRDLHPPSYVYAASKTGYDWKFEQQFQGSPLGRINGYIHWSHSLFDNGEVPDDAFESPAVPSRGAPRTNPGTDINNWEPEQVDGNNNREGDGEIEDRQVSRLAFAANAAIMPRNKFNRTGNDRVARLVKNNKIQRPSNTILFTEFKNTANWRSLADVVGIGGSGASENRIVSHRPITPFIGRSAGQEVFDEPSQFNIARYQYPEVEILENALGSITDDQLGLIVGNGGSESSLEAVNDVFKGKANFAFLDGHVALDEVINTVINRQWGEKFYSMSGNNDLYDPELDDNQP